MDVEKILSKANELGHYLQQHEIVKRFKDLAGQLDRNETSRQLLEDYANTAGLLQQKSEAGLPIEVDDKKQMQELNDKVQADALLMQFLATERYYMHLMSQINEVISHPQGDPPSDSGLIIPGQSQSGLILP